MSSGEITTPVTTEQVIDTITAAGLDYHDFKCGIIARRSTWTPGRTMNLWEEIAEFPSRYDAAVIAKAWELAGMDDPYRDDEVAA